jgi:hypothetical protein
VKHWRHNPDDRPAAARPAAGLVFTAMLGAAGAAGAQTLPAEPDFIFVGSVVAGPAPISRHTRAAASMAVKVERVLKPSDGSALDGYAGQTIAVLEDSADAMSPGMRATFETRVVSFAKVLEVRDLRHKVIPSVAAAEAQAALTKRAAEETVSADRALQLDRQIGTASVVVSGRVTTIRRPPVTAAAKTPARLSEHEPQYSEAIVEISEVVKGKVQGSSLVVRFPTSNDVAWRHHAKLQVGQQGVFLVHEDGQLISQPETAAAGPIEGPPGAAAPPPRPASKVESVLPLARLDEVRQAVLRAQQKQLAVPPAATQQRQAPETPTKRPGPPSAPKVS